MAKEGEGFDPWTALTLGLFLGYVLCHVVMDWLGTIP